VGFVSLERNARSRESANVYFGAAPDLQVPHPYFYIVSPAGRIPIHSMPHLRIRQHDAMYEAL
jgi:hypothetical protein